MAELERFFKKTVTYTSPDGTIERAKVLKEECDCITVHYKGKRLLIGRKDVIKYEVTEHI